MTEAKLDPRVRSLLEDELEARDLDEDVVQRLLHQAQMLEGEELQAAVRETLEE